MAAVFELKPTSDGQVMFNLKAGNGEPILHSERYTTESAARNGIESVRKNAPLDERYERDTADEEHLSFALKAGNGEVIGHSEVYSSLAAMENGIRSVKQNAPIAEIRDLTTSQ